MDNNQNYFFNQENEQPYFKIPNNKIHSIQIELLNEYYKLNTHDESYFLIKGNTLSEKDYELIVKPNTLIFKRNDQHTISHEPYGEGQELSIFLPKNVLLREFHFSSKTGEGTLSNVDADQINISIISGELSLDHIEASNFSLQTTSGEVNLTHLSSSNATFKTTTADIELSHINIKNAIKCISVEGDIDIEDGFAQELFFQTESGDFDGKEFYPNTISFESIDGDLDIKNKKKEHDIIIKSKQTIEGEINIK